jgi:hypothetical protein
MNYLRFEKEADTGRTEQYGVFSALHGDRLGTVKWYGAWRQYAFFPERETVWNRDCPRQLAGFLDEAMRGQQLRRVVMARALADVAR